MVIVGDDAANVLRGTRLADRITGGGGDDAILANSGEDVVFGGAGNDRISGGEGRDELFGGRGDDVIFGFSSADFDAESGKISVKNLAATFERPVFATSAPGDPDRLYVVEQLSGRVMIVDVRTGLKNATPFLDLPEALIAAGGEQGFLGLAFHPDYASNGRLFTYFTQADGDVEVRSFLRSATDPDRVAAGSGDTILVIDRQNTATNHNGGWMDFGPDGMLYIAVGDQSGGPSNNNSQDVNSLWGKILRIDVDGDDFAGNAARDYAIPAGNPFVGRAGADEVWALGLRNPWRNSFDRATGDLYIADVGQNQREEINFQTAGAPGGANYGWRVKEGELVFNDAIPGNPAPDSPQLTDPVVTYAHDAEGGVSVIGGYVYRGQSAGMEGRYVYTDFASNNLWSFRIVDGRAIDVTEHSAQLAGAAVSGVTSFAEDGRGNLYVIGIGGRIAHLDFGAAAGDAGDTISGGDGKDRLYGGAGADVIYGGAGVDRLYGGEGDDLLSGGAQADVLGGGRGDDRLNGGAGDDSLFGGGGDDVMTGGAGADLFVFRSGADVITDFTDDVDTIQLGAAFGFTSVAQAMSFAEQVGDDVVFTFTERQVLTVSGATLAALTDDLLI